ncbi:MULTISPECIES: PAS domain S-box protein [Nostoc]|uniref:PAS domain S-box protein n=1 Tax=Nostoc paludosum FACHB-159 TaxID=2692908 RepID=A0ABR8KGI4_9NOSO|nr:MULTISPECIES: PAS domain S-box protein [Nostoc]MBD2680714.1 PAS domain S-box protein [Nostoc sp. FACHB-857]MBD2737182.1 PAS domain S-box protein [Nostoc paludosum FACHB-159]
MDISLASTAIAQIDGCFNSSLLGFGEATAIVLLVVVIILISWNLIQKRQLQLMQDLIDSIDGVVWEFDLQTQLFTFISQPAEIIFGYPLKRWLTEPGLWESCIYPEDRHRAVEYCKESTQKQQNHSFEYRFITSDNRIIWLRDIVTVITKNQQPTKLRGFMYDISDCKQDEEALRHREEQLQLALEASYMGIWDWNLETNNITWSEGHERLFGLKPGTFGGTYADFAVCVHPEDLEALVQAIENSRQLQQDFYQEFRVVWTDNSIHWIQGKGQFFYNQAGEAVRMVGTVVDISQRKQFEAALQESEARLQAILDYSPAIIFLKDLQGQYLIINRQHDVVSSINRDKIIGHTDYDFFPKEVADKLSVNNQKVLQMGQTIEVEEVVPQDDGDHTYLAVKFPIYDAAGKISGMCGIATDITDRKRAEASLAKSEAKWRSLIQNSSDMVCIQDPEGRMRFVSPSVERILGYKPEELIGKLIIEFISPEDIVFVWNTFEKLLNLPSTTTQLVEYRFRHKDGSWRFLESTGCNLLSDPAIHGIVINSRDVSERKRQETEIHQLNEDLEQRVAQRTAELESLINAIPDHIFVVERQQMRLSFCNDVFAKCIAYENRHQVQGKTVAECFSPEMTAYFIKQNNLVFESGKPLHEHETLNLYDKVHHFETFKIPLKKPNGDVYALLGISHDYTELIQTQQALTERTAQLEAANRELAQHNQEIISLNQMSDFLQVCLNLQESQRVLTQLMPRLFPGCSGAVFLIEDSQAPVEAMSTTSYAHATWGEPTTQTLFSAHECYALRRGQTHFVENIHDGLYCKHILVSSLTTTLCIPMVARGKTCGVLYLSTLVKEHIMAAKQQLAVIVAQHIALALANLKMYETLHNQSIRDPLTGLFNRRYLEESLARELHFVRRHQQCLSVILLDIDHFKHFNDTFGHDAGDTVLQKIADFLQHQIRESDIACRFGGEEMLLILPGASLEDAAQRAEQLRQGVKQLKVEHRHQLLSSITMSIGIACFPEHGISGDILMKVADAALYQAKAQGRDRIVIGNPQ